MTCVLVEFSRSITGSHPLIDVIDEDSRAVDGYQFVADWNADINLAAVGVQTMTQDQLFKLSSVQNVVQQRPQYGTLRNTEQKRLLAE